VFQIWGDKGREGRLLDGVRDMGDQREVDEATGNESVKKTRGYNSAGAIAHVDGDNLAFMEEWCEKPHHGFKMSVLSRSLDDVPAVGDKVQLYSLQARDCSKKDFCKRWET